MEAVSSDRTLVREILDRFAEPAKYKIKLYQIAVLMYIDQLLTLLINKYMFFRSVAIEEKSKLFTVNNLKITRFEQTQIKLDLLSKENLKRTFELVDKIKLEAHFKFEKLQSMHEHCVTHEVTPELFCEPYIHTGFRPINRPYMYYIKSLFFKHNETINAWSHYFGAMYTLYLAFTMDFTDPYSWPILTCLITSTIMFFTSATAHLMHQKSHQCHMTCFLCDFGGISFNGFGAAFMQTYMSSPLWYYALVEPILLPLIGSQSMLCCLFNSLAQTLYKRPYPPIKRFLQFAPCGILWLFTILPVLIRFIVDDENSVTVVHYDYHLTHIVVFLVGATCFALDFPQRFLPGRLDFFGQGHNLFHMCIFLVVAIQFKACHMDFMANRDVIAATREPPSFAFCFLALVALILYYAYVTWQFTRMITHNFDADGNLIDKGDDEKRENDENDASQDVNGKHDDYNCNDLVDQVKLDVQIDVKDDEISVVEQLTIERISDDHLKSE